MDVYAPAGRIVETKLVEMFARRTSTYTPTSVADEDGESVKTASYRRNQLTSLDFEVDTDFLNDEFLVRDVRVGGQRRLIFATQKQLALPQQTRRWYLGGTFQVVKAPFYQLFSIHAFLKNGDALKQVPLMFVLMPKWRKIDYVTFLETVLDVMEEAPSVEGLVMDFEAGMWQAVQQVFPGTNLKGCTFQWAQAVLRNAKNVGLKSTYERREGAHHLIRKLLALLFLPASDILRTFKKLRPTAASAEMEEVFQEVFQ